ncbi:type II toxin-antitoxin system RelE/ParE family toxin [Ferrovibrio sp.]|uniref:type II toxin-antitoxin system RelE/ParE family toxin n=1 Tax=Ferrovibrio sp. TaxID=1917215 RepID=UPI003D0BEE89
MGYEVFLAEDAEQDIVDIHRFVATQDGLQKADRLLAALETVCLRLAELPLRGHVPKELRTLGITDFLEAHFKPYRIIYRVLGRQVIVYCVLDGRRDMQTLLQRRLLISGLE